MAERSPGDLARTFEADLHSVPLARRFVTTTLDGWGLGSLAGDATLCTSELVTNAVLHARSPFEVRVGRSGEGVRVEVADTSTRRVDVSAPPARPRTPAGDVTSLEELEVLLAGQAMSGRGLLVVEGLADAWGVEYHEASKTVWFALQAPPPFPPAAPGSPGRVGPAPRPDDRVTVRLLDVPVRVTVASSNHIDDIVREFQLISRGTPGVTGIPVDLVEAVEQHLERTVVDRHHSRARARTAAEHGHPRFDMEMVLPRRARGMLHQLNELLDEVGELSAGGRLLALPPADEVVEFRRWCADEIDRQLTGAPPSPCPFPD